MTVHLEMKKILSIDAGGIRGIIPSLILADLEARAGQPICNLFDLFAGTSTGGLLVLGLNCPEVPGRACPLYSATELPTIFYDWGHRIFASKRAAADSARAETSSAGRIEAMLCEYFGDRLLRDCIRPTLVTAFDLTAEQPFFFNSAKAENDILGYVFMWQAGRATTCNSLSFRTVEVIHSVLSSRPIRSDRWQLVCLQPRHVRIGGSASSVSCRTRFSTRLSRLRQSQEPVNAERFAKAETPSG